MFCLIQCNSNFSSKLDGDEQLDKTLSEINDQTIDLIYKQKHRQVSVVLITKLHMATVKYING